MHHAVLLRRAINMVQWEDRGRFNGTMTDLQGLANTQLLSIWPTVHLLDKFSQNFRQIVKIINDS